MNIQELKNYLNCDDTFLTMLMQKFIDEVAEITATLKTAAANNEWAIVRSNAHKMLSSVRIFEMREIIVVLEKIEIEAEAKKKPEIITKDINKLSILIDKVINDMKTAIEEISQ